MKIHQVFKLKIKRLHLYHFKTELLPTAEAWAKTQI